MKLCALRAHVPTCLKLLRAYVPRVFMRPHANMPCVPTGSRAINAKSK